MPPITKSDVHVDRPLTNFLVAHPANEFIAHRVLPIVPVKFESDQYYRIHAGHRIVKDSRRAADAPSQKVEFGYTADTYTANEYALHADVPHRVAQNADDPLSPYEDAAMTAREMVLLDIERTVAAIAQASALPKGAPTAKWDAADLSTVKLAKDVLGAKEEVRSKLGRPPNAILMSAAVANAVRIYLLEQKNGAGVEFSTVEQYLTAGDLPPRIWGMETIIGNAVKSSKLRPESVAAANLSDVWNDNVLVFYKAPNPGIRTISFGYTFRVRNSEMVRRDTYEGPIRADWTEYCVTEAHKVVSEDACFMIEDVLT